MGDDCLHSSCWCRIDPGPAFLLHEGSTQASAVDSHRTAGGFRSKTKKIVVSVAVIFFRERNSQASHILTSRRAWCMQPQGQTLAASLGGHLGLFKLSVGQFPIENPSLGIDLPQLFLNLYSDMSPSRCYGVGQSVR